MKDMTHSYFFLLFYVCFGLVWFFGGFFGGLFVGGCSFVLFVFVFLKGRG